MEQKTIWQDFASLPPELQQQVLDFIAFLRTRNADAGPRKAAKQVSLEDEAFIGMWQDRQDLEDSSAWVRKVREDEWVKSRA